jgi:hypothetical protein
MGISLCFPVQIPELSCDPYGCRVIQRLLEKAGSDQRTAILSEVFVILESLVQDQYGNYVVQHILGKKHVCLCYLCYTVSIYSKVS